MKTLITEVSGVIDAPVERVRDALFDAMLPPDKRRGRFEVEDLPGHTSTAEVTEWSVAMQGGWWYRGEWSVEPHQDGALLVHRVYNVATRMRWGVPLANRFFVGFDKTTRAAFADRIAQLKRKLI